MAERGGSIIVVGAGMFGVASALALARRGYAVTLMDRGPLPHPRAASFDTSRLVRLDYGTDELHVELIERALHIWRRWNEIWRTPVFFESGVLVLAGSPMRPGGFEHSSMVTLQRRGHSVTRLDRDALASRFPSWSGDWCPDSYYNPQGGWVDATRVMERLLVDVRAAGVRVRQGWSFGQLLTKGNRVVGVVGRDQQRVPAEVVVMATGAWTPHYLPELSERMWASGVPIIFLRPDDPEPFRAEVFPPWTADIANTGWYGFPADRDGLVKLVNHGIGRRLHPDAPRDIDGDELSRARAFLRRAVPSLADAPAAATRMGPFCDTFDGDFWIAKHPELSGLMVAAGGSGHAFKFAPVVGEIVADALEDRPNAFAERFAWRELSDQFHDQSRHRG